MKNYISLLVMALAIFLAGCGGGSSSSAPSVPVVAAPAPTGVIQSLGDTQKMSIGATAYVLLDRPGGVVTVPVTFDVTSNDANGRSAYFTVADPKIPVGSGDSGSTVITAQGEVVGALAFGWTGNDSKFGVTSADDMLTAGRPLSGATLASQKEAIRYSLIGISLQVIKLMKMHDSKNPLLGFNPLTDSQWVAARNVSKTKGAAMAMPGYGQSIAVVLSKGDMVSAYAEGSATMPHGGKFLAFGHPLNWGGKDQVLPVYTVNVLEFVTTPQGSFKFGVPTGQYLGTMTGDHKFGVVIDPKVEAKLIPVSLDLTLDGNPKPRLNGQVAQDPNYAPSLCALNLVQGVANVLDAYNTKGSLSGTLVYATKDGKNTSLPITITDSLGVLSHLYQKISQVFGGYSDDPSSAPAPLDLTSVSFTATLLSL